MKTQSSHVQLNLTKSFRPAASLVLSAALAFASIGTSTAADPEAKANTELFNKLASALKAAPKVARITYTASLLSGKMRMALVSDGAHVVCFLSDGKSSNLSLEGSLEKGNLLMTSNPMGHEISGSRATFVGRMTATDFSGTLTLSGVRFSVAGRAAAAKSPAGVYHLYTGGLGIAVAVDEAGNATATARRVKTGEVLSAKVTTPVAAGSLPRTSVYSPTGTLVTTVDVRRVRSPILGLLHLWSDAFNSAVKPVAVSIGEADLLGNPIRPYDVAVIQNPTDPLPATLVYSERVQRRIVLFSSLLATSQDGNQLTIADFGDWRDTRTAQAGQPGYLAVYQNRIAVETRTDPGYDATLNQIPQYGQLSTLRFPADSLILENSWSQHADHVGNLVKNPNSDGVSFGFTWTQQRYMVGGYRQPDSPRMLIRTSAEGVHRVLSDKLEDFTSEIPSNAIGQIGTFPQSFMVPIKRFDNPLFEAHLVTDNSTSTSQAKFNLKDSSGQLMTGNYLFSEEIPMTLDGMDLKGFRVIDGARMEDDAIFLLTKHLNYWKLENSFNVVSDGAGGLMTVGEPPRYREVAFGPLNFEEADRSYLTQYSTTEPAMWALVRINAQGVATLYHKGNEPIFATGLDVESTPEGKHVLVADNGPAGFGGRIIRVAPNQAALDAYQQRIQDNQGQ